MVREPELEKPSLATGVHGYLRAQWRWLAGVALILALALAAFAWVTRGSPEVQM